MTDPHAYGSLAELYDSLMSYVPYQNWVEMIHEISRKYASKERPRIFELGGGTGTLGSMLTFEEYPYLGSDISPQMCRVAWDKGLDYITTDCRSISLRDSFDMVIFCFDGINYLQEKEDYKRCFKSVYTVLEEGGLFFFDVTTKNNSVTYFEDYTEAESFENGSYIRHSFFDSCTDIQHNDFDIYLKIEGEENRFARYREEHMQKVFPVEDVERLVPRDLFTIEGIWGDFTFETYTPISERVHFLLRKK